MNTIIKDPKYIRKFNENREELLSSAIKYADKDSDFILSGADKEICRGANISLRAFRETYSAVGRNDSRGNHVYIFLYDCDYREAAYLQNVRENDIKKLLWHISDEKNLYLLETKRRRYFLHSQLVITLAKMLNIRVPTGVESMLIILDQAESKLRMLWRIIFLWEKKCFSAHYITQVEKILNSVNKHEIDGLLN